MLRNLPALIIMSVWLAGASAATNSPSPAATSSPPTRIKVVFLGDSITDGYGVEKHEAFPNLLADKFAKSAHPIEAVNAGISGSTSASGPARVRWLLKSKPDIIMIELGANDALRGQKIEMTKANLKTTINLVTAQDVKVVLVGMSLPRNYGEDYRKKFSNLYTELAKEKDVYFIPFIEKFLGNKSLVQSDGLHPNAKGHELIAEELYPHLAPIVAASYKQAASDAKNRK